LLEADAGQQNQVRHAKLFQINPGIPVECLRGLTEMAAGQAMNQ
jgi:hypothetical protein